MSGEQTKEHRIKLLFVEKYKTNIFIKTQLGVLKNCVSLAKIIKKFYCGFFRVPCRKLAQKTLQKWKCEAKHRQHFNFNKNDDDVGDFPKLKEK
jgi:hypothetical protein